MLWKICGNVLASRGLKRFLGKNTNLALRAILSLYHLLVSYCNKAGNAQNVIRYHQRSNCYKT